MPDIANRADREAKLKAVVLEVFNEWRANPGRSWPVFQSRLRIALGPELAETYKDAAKQLAALVAIVYGEDDLDLIADSWSGNYSGVLAGEITVNTDSAFQRARNERTSGTITEEEEAERIDRWLGEARADRIAATETTRANTAGEREASREFTRQTGKLLFAAWRCEEGACPICEPLDGEPEEVWADEFPSGPPEPHISCRCWLEWDVAPEAAEETEESEN